MKSNVSIYDFRDTIMKLRPNNFSYEGLTILYEWFEEYEESCETEVDFDPIGICCEFTEASWEEIANDYDIELPNKGDDIYDRTMNRLAVAEYLQDNTLFMCDESTPNFVYAAF